MSTQQLTTFEDLEKAVLNLNRKFMSIEDYNIAINSDKLEKLMWNDGENKSPDHPMLSPNKAVRMKAADLFRDYKKELSRDMLSNLHKHLFDCCAAVRLSLAGALLHSGDDTSIEPLEKLSHTESESKMVKAMAGIALEVLKDKKGYLPMRQFLYVGDLEEGRANGKGKMYYSGIYSLIYEGEFKNNFFQGQGKYYNDDGTIKYEGLFKDGKFVKEY